MKKEDLLKALESNPDVLVELIKENPDLKSLVKQAMKAPREKSLKDKLNKWGITEIPNEYLEHLSRIEDFLNWLDREIQEITDGERGLHFSLRPLKHTKKNQESQEN